jgi:hypothetical protein
MTLEQRLIDVSGRRYASTWPSMRGALDRLWRVGTFAVDDP